MNFKKLTNKTTTFSIAAALSAAVLLPGTANATPLEIPNSQINIQNVVSIDASQKITTYSTTTNVNLRKGAGVKHSVITVVKKGANLTKTGKKSGAWVQVKANGKTGWMNGTYIKSTTKTIKPSSPKTTIENNNYVTNTGLNMRSTASASSALVVTMPKGTGVTKTGKTSGSWWQIKSGPYTGWVNSAYLTKGTATEMKKTVVTTPKKVTLHKNAVNVQNKVKSLYGSYISSIGGVREGSVGHSSGVAIDLMIKNYKTKTGISNGNKIAEYLIKNHAALNIDYLIWQDKIWLGPNTGWKPYSASGKYGTQFTNNWNDTTKHLDHIHVEVKK